MRGWRYVKGREERGGKTERKYSEKGEKVGICPATSNVNKAKTSISPGFSRVVSEIHTVRKHHQWIYPGRCDTIELFGAFSEEWSHFAPVDL